MRGGSSEVQQIMLPARTGEDWNQLAFGEEMDFESLSQRNNTMNKKRK
jgi:hypothetical protein